MKIKLLLFSFIVFYSFSESLITKEDLVFQPLYEEEISLAINFLINRQKMDGSFVYDHQPFTGESKYNGGGDYWVRIAGTLMSMAFSYDGKNKKLKKSIDKSLEFFESHSIEFERKGLKLSIISNILVLVTS